MKKNLVLFVALLTLSTTIFSAPLQLSLPGTNLPNEDSVSGLRANLFYGKTSDVKGVDISLIGLSEMDNFSGLGVGFLGARKINNEFKGLSLGLFNYNTGKTSGMNFGLVNITNKTSGVNLAFVNKSQDINGANIGFINVTTGDTLMDLGLINYAESATFQIGLINATNNLDGLQVGLVNYARNGVLPVMPIINFKKSF